MNETSQPISKENIDERRQYHRLDRASTIHYQSLENFTDQGEMKQAELCDLGGGGIRFLTSEPLPKNEQLVIELLFIGWQERGDDWVRTGNSDDVGYLKAIGAVMWCSENKKAGSYEVGLRFTGRVRE